MPLEGLDRGSCRRVGDQQLNSALSLEEEAKDLQATAAIEKSRHLRATRSEPLDVGSQLTVEETLAITAGNLDQGPSGESDLGALVKETIKR